ncbi:MAG: 5'-nucleotidase C-terminal domain-containing protein [Flavisolibacter sp.]
MRKLYKAFRCNKGFKFTALFFLCSFNSLNVFSQPTSFTVVYVNDTHSHLDSYGPKDANLDGEFGGIAKAATVIGGIRATEPNVLLLHAGDAFVGDFMFNKYFGVPELQLMKQLHFDAMAVGNHELDFGPAALTGSLNAAFAGGSFPLLSANLNLLAYPALQTWIQPSTIKIINNVKIGIFGMTVPHVPTSSALFTVDDNVVAIAQQSINNLKAAGANVVICLSHLGIYYDKIVAQNTTGIDFIIGGHDHLLFRTPVLINNLNGVPVPIFQAGKYYKNIGKLHFTYNNGSVVINDYSIINLDENVPKAPAIQAVIDQLKQGIVAKYGDVYHTAIATAKNDILDTIEHNLPFRDVPIGNLVTDAFRQKTGTEIAVTALGMLREQLYQGPIVPADVFRTLSLGYDPATGLGLKLSTFEITGENLLKAIEFGLSQLTVTKDFFLQFSGLDFRYDLSKPSGQQVDIKTIRVNGKKWSPLKTYTVTANAAIIALAPSLGVSINNIHLLDDFEYTVVKDYLAAQKGVVNYRSEGRILEKHIGNDEDCPEDKTVSQEFSGQKILGEQKLPPAVYPNPFAVSTNFSFSVAKQSAVVINVYDQSGKLLSTLLNKQYQPGNYTYQWRSTNLATGVYFFSITTAEGIKTGKLIQITP